MDKAQIDAALAAEADLLEAVRLANTSAWAIRPDVLSQISQILAARLHGERAGLQRSARAGIGRATAGDVAIVPLRGVVTPRGGALTEIFGGAPLELFRARLREALADNAIASIVIDADGPGGTVNGVPETAAEISAARGKGKPIVAVASGLDGAASATYWLASQADELVVSPSAEVGSIGVWTMHVDASEYFKKLGFNMTLITAGKYKVEDHPFGPLSDEARAHMEASVADTHEEFIAAVAKGRRTTQKAVREGFGLGRMVPAARAVKEGMADRVATLDDVVSKLRGKGGKVVTPPPGASSGGMGVRSAHHRFAFGG